MFIPRDEDVTDVADRTLGVADEQQMIRNDSGADADAESDADQISASCSFAETVFRADRGDLSRDCVDRQRDLFGEQGNGDVGSEFHAEVSAGDDDSVFRIDVAGDCEAERVKFRPVDSALRERGFKNARGGFDELFRRSVRRRCGLHAVENVEIHVAEDEFSECGADVDSAEIRAVRIDAERNDGTSRGFGLLLACKETALIQQRVCDFAHGSPGEPCELLDILFRCIVPAAPHGVHDFDVIRHAIPFLSGTL